MSNDYKAINLDHMDISVRPGDDFFRFVNGKWLEQAKIPDDRERWGSFDELRKKTDENTLTLLDKITKGDIKTSDPDIQKAISFAEVALDVEGNIQSGLSAIKGILDEIEVLSSLIEVKAFVSKHVSDGFAGLLSFSVFPDLRDSKANALYIGGPSLGLPERDYYLNEGEQDEDIRNKYLEYIGDLMSLYRDQTVNSKLVFQFEKDMAKVLLSKEDSRNPQNIYHPKTLDDLTAISSSLEWEQIYSSCDLSHEIIGIVTEASYFDHLDTILSVVDLDTIKDYLTFTVLNASAPYISGKYEECNFNFYGRQLGGTQNMRPLKERVLAVLNSVIGEAIGKLYVEQYFPEEAKEKAVELVDYVKKAFRNRIQELTWMSSDTKQKALDKLASFGVKIAYPDKWKDYGALLVKGKGQASYLENILIASQWKLSKDLKKVGQDVDKSEWHMAPQVVNAYYNPLNNEIVFPAAILQAPFYDFHADPAVNFGGIGAVIAHEMTHGFDDQGRRFDKQGNMIDWWSDEDAKRFRLQNEKLISQADTYEIIEGLHLNGTFTLGENLADLGGVLVGYEAMQLYFQEYALADRIDGYTQAQRFFMSWATVWRGKTREAALRKQIATDPHPPFEFRALNPLTNVQAFYEAFELRESDEMYRNVEERVNVW